MLKDYDVVQLVCDLDGEGLKAGTHGAVVMVYPSNPPEYEVEFVSKEGETIAVATVAEEQIRKAEEKP